MIHLYTWGTPNGRKASIMLEECGLPYEVHAIDIRRGDQKQPEFLVINPNGKIPAIVDEESGTRTFVFESGAILLYLAEKVGRFLGSTPQERIYALSWTFWQVGGIGPMMGQWNHFNRSAPEKLPYALARFRDESRRLLDVLDSQLAGREFIVGPFTIADVASYPWIAAALRVLGEEMPNLSDEVPNVAAWAERVGRRPAVIAGMKIPQG
jgi:GST-like protein